MTPYRDLTDDEWRCIVPLLPEMRPRTELRGRPLANTRAVMNGVLWVIYSGATWSSMPRRYPSYQTCHRRFKIWHEAGVLKQVLCMLYGHAGEDLSNVLSSRMRVHAHSKAAIARRLMIPPPVCRPAKHPAAKHPVYDEGIARAACADNAIGLTTMPQPDWLSAQSRA